MAVKVRMSINGLDKVEGIFERLEFRVHDARPAWDAIARSFAIWMGKQFRSEGAYNGGPWKPLSKQYAKWKQRHYPEKTILQRSGRLIDQLTKEPFGVDVREPRYMIYGTALRYGRFHQDGSGKLPKREIITMTDNISKNWRKLIQRHLVENFR